MNKYALCLSGYHSSNAKVGLNVPQQHRDIFDISFIKYQENLLSQNNIDVFIHTWTADLNDEYIAAFKPKAYIIEDQPNFLNRNFPAHLFPKKSTQQMLFAKTLGMKKVVELCKNSGVDYRMIVLSRPDISWLVPIYLDDYDPELFHSDSHPKLDYQNRSITFKEVLKAQIPYDQLRIKQLRTIGDTVFASKPENIAMFATLYDNLMLYLSIYASRLSMNQAGDIDVHSVETFHLSQLGLLRKSSRSFIQHKMVCTTRELL